MEVCMSTGSAGLAGLPAVAMDAATQGALAQMGGDTGGTCLTIPKTPSGIFLAVLGGIQGIATALGIITDSTGTLVTLTGCAGTVSTCAAAQCVEGSAALGAEVDRLTVVRGDLEEQVGNLQGQVQQATQNNQQHQQQITTLTQQVAQTTQNNQQQQQQISTLTDQVTAHAAHNKRLEGIIANGEAAVKEYREQLSELRAQEEAHTKRLAELQEEQATATTELQQILQQQQQQQAYGQQMLDQQRQQLVQQEQQAKAHLHHLRAATAAQVQQLNSVHGRYESTARALSEAEARLTRVGNRLEGATEQIHQALGTPQIPVNQSAGHKPLGNTRQVVQLTGSSGRGMSTSIQSQAASARQSAAAAPSFGNNRQPPHASYQPNWGRGQSLQAPQQQQQQQQYLQQQQQQQQQKR